MKDRQNECHGHGGMDGHAHGHGRHQAIYCFYGIVRVGLAFNESSLRYLG